MKKFLLSLAILAIAGITTNLAAQCSNAPIKKYFGVGDPDYPGLIPITINAASSDWESSIVGPFNYASAPKGGYEGDPYLLPQYPGNVQVDGLRNQAGVERDAVGQDHRDLRYFAFVYDKTNIYFLFRRPLNNTAQVSLYYFIDMNADGFMKSGEPVVHVTFNNSGSDIEMGYYEAVNSNATAAGSYDATKGNSMVATVDRIGWYNGGSSNTSVWEIGLADGWSMPGNFVALKNNVNPPALIVRNGIQEQFAASTLIDTHPDGTVSGYGVEFVIPWNYISMYTATGATPGTALTYQNVFTYHVSLVSGASGVSGAEDNAGGCCAGSAASANANFNYSSSSITPTSPLSNNTNYTLKIAYQNQVAAGSTIELSQLLFKGFSPAGAMTDAQLKDLGVTVYKDLNNDGILNGAEPATASTYSYDNTATLNNGGTVNGYIYLGPGGDGSEITVAGLNDLASYIMAINTKVFGLKQFTVETKTNEEIIGTNTNACAGANTPSTTNQDILINTTLPVNFKNFTAARNQATVLLKWETATEENSAGFALERNVRGNWEEIAYVPSQALNGNSSSVLNYQYTDLNDVKGISQYRVRQIDLNGKASYSVIRAVRGQGQLGNTVVFPNPTSNGKVSVVFEDASTARDVTLVDMAGRVIKQWRNAVNNIQIDNLTPGMYSLKIMIPGTGEQSVQKIVVTKQ